MHGRALPVEFGSLRIGTNQAVFVSRFELMRIACKRLQICNTVVTRTSRKHIVKYKCAQRCVSTGTAAANCHALAVNVASPLEIAGGVDTILDIDDSPTP